MSHWPDPAELLSRLVAAPSISGNEHPALDVLEAAFSAVGVRSVRHGRNLVATWGHASGPSLWMNSHLDTVKVPEGYSFDPFSGKHLDDRVLGLGSNDAKGSIVAMAETFVRFVQANPAGFGGQLSFVAVCDEETGGEGTEFLRKVLPKPDAALVGEPNALVVSNACKGLVRAFVNVHGLSAHASRPWQGNNAIRLAAPVLDRLCAERDFPLDDLLGITTLEPTMIQGGTGANAIAGEVKITLDGRTTPAFDNVALVAWLRAQLADLPGVSVDIKSQRINATRTAGDGRLVQAALASVGQAGPAPFPSVCDFVWLGDCDALVMGPGQLERSHKPDEFLLVDELDAGVRAYGATVDAYFGVSR